MAGRRLACRGEIVPIQGLVTGSTAGSTDTRLDCMFRDLKIWLRLRLEEFRVREIVRRLIRKLVQMALSDLDLMAALRGIDSSVAFERAHLRDAADFKGRHQLYRYMLSHL
jgi:hypothetical protein